MTPPRRCIQTGKPEPLCDHADLHAERDWLRAAGDRLAEALRTVVAYGNEVGHVAEVLYLIELEDWEQVRPLATGESKEGL